MGAAELGAAEMGVVEMGAVELAAAELAVWPGILGEADLVDKLTDELGALEAIA